MAEFISGLAQNAANLDWGLIMSTLIVRFVGVFVVLAVMMIGMMILGKVVSALISMKEARGAEEPKIELSAIALAEEPEMKTGEEEVVAAIGAAIAMAMEQHRKIAAPAAPAGAAAGSWTMAGRAAQMSTRLQGGTHRRS